jgi:hypothetical protein
VPCRECPSSRRADKPEQPQRQPDLRVEHWPENPVIAEHRGKWPSQNARDDGAVARVITLFDE